MEMGLRGGEEGVGWLKNNIFLRAAVGSVHGPWLLEHQTKGLIPQTSKNRLS